MVATSIAICLLAIINALIMRWVANWKFSAEVTVGVLSLHAGIFQQLEFRMTFS